MDNRAAETRRANEASRKAKRQREREEWEALKASLLQIANNESAKPETRLEAIKMLEQRK